MADQGPATGTPEYSAGGGVFLEVHTQNNFQSAASSGIPGGISGPASGSNNLGPGVFQGGTEATCYGTRSDGSASPTIFINLQGTLPTPTSIIKNPA